jgi:hypothetical protein
MDNTMNDNAAVVGGRSKKRRRAILAILLGSSLAMIGAGNMSLAYFTSTNSNSASWTSGTIVLGVSPATVFNPGNIFPGDTGNKDVTVSNTGTGQLRYAMTGVSTDGDVKALSGQLTLLVQAGTCAAPGATLYSGALSGAKFGNPAAGPNTGDRVVAAGGTDPLCFTWTFPSGSGNGFQGASTSTVFTFDGEQTVNNP